MVVDQLIPSLNLSIVSNFGHHMVHCYPLIFFPDSFRSFVCEAIYAAYSAIVFTEQFIFITQYREDVIHKVLVVHIPFRLCLYA